MPRVPIVMKPFECKLHVQISKPPLKITHGLSLQVLHFIQILYSQDVQRFLILKQPTQMKATTFILF